MDIHEILYSIRTDVSEIRVSQARTEQDVAYHIKRTDLLEESVAQARAEAEARSKAIADSIEPLKQAHEQRTGMIKVGAALLGIGGLVVAVIELFIK